MQYIWLHDLKFLERNEWTYQSTDIWLRIVKEPCHDWHFQQRICYNFLYLFIFSGAPRGISFQVKRACVAGSPSLDLVTSSCEPSPDNKVFKIQLIPIFQGQRLLIMVCVRQRTTNFYQDFVLSGAYFPVSPPWLCTVLKADYYRWKTQQYPSETETISIEISCKSTSIKAWKKFLEILNFTSLHHYWETSWHQFIASIFFNLLAWDHPQ